MGNTNVAISRQIDAFHWLARDSAELLKSVFVWGHRLGFLPGTEGLYPSSADAVAREHEKQFASLFSLSQEAKSLLKEVESLHLLPYDDQTGKDIEAWVKGATIGYGHLIPKHEWNTYMNGFKEEKEVSALFDKDLAPFVSAVRNHITAKIMQNQFDALVIFAFNIGREAFSSSSVVKMVNDPRVKTNYASLELAWKAWNKSQGKVMKGLENRRKCEWDIYSKGIYKRW